MNIRLYNAYILTMEKDRAIFKGELWVKDEKIVYVANNDYTKYKLTSSASELQDKIEDDAQGNYLFYLDRYAEIQFNIGRIIK